MKCTFAKREIPPGNDPSCLRPSGIQKILNLHKPKLPLLLVLLLLLLPALLQYNDEKGVEERERERVSEVLSNQSRPKNKFKTVPLMCNLVLMHPVEDLPP